MEFVVAPLGCEVIYDNIDGTEQDTAKIISIHPHNLSCELAPVLHVALGTTDTRIVVHTLNHIVPVNRFLSRTIMGAVDSRYIDMYHAITRQHKAIIVSTGGVRELSLTGMHEDGCTFVVARERKGIFRLAKETHTGIRVCLGIYGDGECPTYPTTERIIRRWLNRYVPQWRIVSVAWLYVWGLVYGTRYVHWAVVGNVVHTEEEYICELDRLCRKHDANYLII